MYTFLRYNSLKVKKNNNRFNGCREYICILMYISTIEWDKGDRLAEGTQLYNKINPPLCFSDKLNWGIMSDCVCNKVLRQRVSGRHIDCVDLVVDLFICWVPCTSVIILVLSLFVFCPVDFIDKSLGEMMI